MKKLMILGASILQLPAIEKAIEMGLETIVVDMNPNAVGFDIKGVYKEIISTNDITSIVEAAKKHKIDGIITLATDMPVRSIAAVAHEMQLVGISNDTAIKATNKVEMRNALAYRGVPVPKYFKASNKEEYLRIVKKFKIPFIVKPVDSSGSRGIIKVSNLNNEKEIIDAYEYSSAFSKCGDVIVEEYMNGLEVSVETLSVNGVCHVIQITDKITTGAPHYVEMGHTQPTRLEKSVIKQIESIAIAANHAVGILNGPSHTEIIITNEGPKIVEIGARLGGDCITTHLVPLSTGIDMVECCIRIALGETPDIQKKFSRGSAIRYFKQSVGIIKKIDGIKIAQSMPGVKQVSVVHGVGESIKDIDSSTARIGFVITQGKNAYDAEELCEKAVEVIDIDIEK